LDVSPTDFEFLTLNAGKWIVLPTPPLFDAPLGRGDSLEFMDKTYPAKTRGMGLPYGENLIILGISSTVFHWFTRVTERQTDGRSIAHSAQSIYALCCRALKIEVSWVNFSTYNAQQQY